MSSKRKEYKVDASMRKVALFFLACEPNPVTRLSIPAVMRARKCTLMRKLPIQSSDGRGGRINRCVHDWDCGDSACSCLWHSRSSTSSSSVTVMIAASGSTKSTESSTTSDVIIERLILLSNYYCTPPPFNFFHRLTSSSAARHRRPLSSHHPLQPFKAAKYFNFYSLLIFVDLIRRPIRRHRVPPACSAPSTRPPPLPLHRPSQLSIDCCV